ncbi:MAG: TIGR00159 family protein [Anaerofustis stercorihominis]|nr:TIGR00159 family protein [Anaerofustis stercorihominis]
MGTLFNSGIFDIFKAMNIASVIDIAITAFAIYKLISWIRGTQAEQVVYGLVIIFAITQLSDWFGFITINYVLKSFMTVGLLALVIMFQPELRHALTKLGSSRFKIFNFTILGNILGQDVSAEAVQDVVTTLIDTLKELSATKTGALIVMEREARLTDIINSGVYLDAKVSKSLLLNIFYPKTPMHDGAVVIGSNHMRITAAACLLPLTQNPNLNPSLGTRHRAAIGISEKSDCIVLVVSEETGVLSYAIGGRLSRFVDLKTIEAMLNDAFMPAEKKSLFRSLGGGNDEK